MGIPPMWSSSSWLVLYKDNLVSCAIIQEIKTLNSYLVPIFAPPCLSSIFPFSLPYYLFLLNHLQITVLFAYFLFQIIVGA
jgi:hypothetical protein